jgi:hypothetical protein
MNKNNFEKTKIRVLHSGIHFYSAINIFLFYFAAKTKKMGLI